MSTQKPWGGRFVRPTDEIVETFTSSIEGDRNIALDDVEGSLAHATMLAEAGIVSADDGALLVRGLREIQAELERDSFQWNPKLEDVHMNIERRLAELVGEEVAGRLHTARSRNDQVALDLRLHLRRRIREIDGKLRALERALVERASEHIGTLMPGYTHLQRAQPVRLAHHLLAHREALKRDRGRIADASRRASTSPLGAGALSGTTHPIRRERVAELLGLVGVTANSIDAVSSRDAALEVLSASAISMVNLSRLAEELVLWSTAEFGFCAIDDAFATGSSMMPQKKNPDVAELVRGRCGRVVGDLVSLLVTMKGLPLAYNRDMQEDKPPLYDSLATWSACIDLSEKMLRTTTFDVTRMRKALDEGFVLATELADHLATRGVPFREAHHVVGAIVRHCISHGTTLEMLALEELRAFHPSFGDDACAWLDPERAVERRDVPGGPARKRVEEAIRVALLELDAAT